MGMSEPLFVFTESEQEFLELLETRSVQQIEGAIRVYELVIIPVRDTPGTRRELALLRAALDRRTS
jgi:hypothetical protein